MYLPYDSTIPLLGIYLQERKHEHIKRFLSEYSYTKNNSGGNKLCNINNKKELLQKSIMNLKVANHKRIYTI